MSPGRYKALVRALPCCACRTVPPEGSVPHHITVGRGVGQKVSDFETIPLCYIDHDAFHAAVGRFRGWTKERRRDWQLEQVARTQKALGYSA